MTVTAHPCTPPLARAANMKVRQISNKDMLEYLRVPGFKVPRVQI